MYEFVLHYLDLVQETYGKRLKEMVIVQDFLTQAANRPPVPVGWLPPAYLVPQMRANVVTALDGVDGDRQPLISLSAINTTRGRVHLPTLSAPPSGLQPATPSNPAIPPEAPPLPEIKGKKRGRAK